MPFFCRILFLQLQLDTVIKRIKKTDMVAKYQRNRISLQKNTGSLCFNSNAVFNTKDHREKKLFICLLLLTKDHRVFVFFSSLKKKHLWRFHGLFMESP